MDNHSYLFDDPHHHFHNRKLDFLVIAPPKTGSTWLAKNLLHHPRLFIPELKEVKYFNSLFKWLDYGWYSAQFDKAGSRRSGEASPSYATLPQDSIQRLHTLFPDLKLVYLMRDPISRAWSHAKHNHKYREVNFSEIASFADPSMVPEEQWRANFCNEWMLASGDYLGQLRRWLSVFPKNQVFVGFYESIATRPDALLRDIFRFLNVDSELDLSVFPVKERFLQGSTLCLPPALATILGSLLRDRTNELFDYLKNNFNLEPPQEWQTTLQQSSGTERFALEPFQRDCDEEYLAGIAAREETFASAFRFIETYRGFNIVIYRGRMYALPRSLGRNAIFAIDQAKIQQLQNEGSCIVGRTFAEVKERITTKLLEQAQSRIYVLESQILTTHEVISERARQAHAETARVAAELSAVIALLQQPSRLRRFLRPVLGPIRRRLRTLLSLPGRLNASIPANSR